MCLYEWFVCVSACECVLFVGVCAEYACVRFFCAVLFLSSQCTSLSTATLRELTFPRASFPFQKDSKSVFQKYVFFVCLCDVFIRVVYVGVCCGVMVCLSQVLLHRIAHFFFALTPQRIQTHNMHTRTHRGHTGALEILGVTALLADVTSYTVHLSASQLDALDGIGQKSGLHLTTDTMLTLYLSIHLSILSLFFYLPSIKAFSLPSHSLIIFLQIPSLWSLLSLPLPARRRFCTPVRHMLKICHQLLRPSKSMCARLEAWISAY